MATDPFQISWSSGRMSGTFRGPDGSRFALNSQGEIVPAKTRRINAQARHSGRGFGGLAEYYGNQNFGSFAWDRLQASRYGFNPATANRGKPLPAASNSVVQTIGFNTAVNPSGASPATITGAHSGSITDQWSQVNAGADPSIGLGMNDTLSISGALADGGTAKKDNTYIVNEFGLESFKTPGQQPKIIPGAYSLFTPNKTGKVIPADKTQQLMNEGKIKDTVASSTVNGTAIPQGYNPYAYRNWMQRSAPGTYGAGPSYGEIFEAAERSGINMDNAPDNLPALQRYVRMGLRQQRAFRSAASAVRTKRDEQEAQAAAQVGPPSFARYGVGSARYGIPTESGSFETEGGERMNFRDWRADNIVRQRTTARGGRLPELRRPAYTWEELARTLQ